MKVTRYESAQDFLARARTWLEQNEAANNLIVGIPARLAQHPERIKAQPYLATVEDDGRLVAAAVMTPPHRVILYSDRGEDPAPLRIILEDLQAGSWNVPGVIGPSLSSRAFSEQWSARMGRPYLPAMRERVYELRHVTPPAGVPGVLRVAIQDEIPMLADWVYRFMVDAHLDAGELNAREIAELRVADGDLFLWDDGGPVSMAARTRHTTHGVVVSLVYTPPEHRNRGYASACVAALSQRLLDAGWHFCALFTDLANPTSNSIYQRIGYRPVCDFNEYDFEQ